MTLPIEVMNDTGSTVLSLFSPDVYSLDIQQNFCDGWAKVNYTSISNSVADDRTSNLFFEMRKRARTVESALKLKLHTALVSSFRNVFFFFFGI